MGWVARRSEPPHTSGSAVVPSLRMFVLHSSAQASVLATPVSQA